MIRNGLQTTFFKKLCTHDSKHLEIVEKDTQALKILYSLLVILIENLDKQGFEPLDAIY